MCKIGGKRVGLFKMVDEDEVYTYYTLNLTKAEARRALRYYAKLIEDSGEKEEAKNIRNKLNAIDKVYKI